MVSGFTRDLRSCAEIERDEAEAFPLIRAGHSNASGYTSAPTTHIGVKQGGVGEASALCSACHFHKDTMRNIGRSVHHVEGVVWLGRIGCLSVATVYFISLYISFSSSSTAIYNILGTSLRSIYSRSLSLISNFGHLEVGLRFLHTHLRLGERLPLRRLLLCRGLCWLFFNNSRRHRRIRARSLRLLGIPLLLLHLGILARLLNFHFLYQGRLDFLDRNQSRRLRRCSLPLAFALLLLEQDCDIVTVGLWSGVRWLDACEEVKPIAGREAKGSERQGGFALWRLVSVNDSHKEESE